MDKHVNALALDIKDELEVDNTEQLDLEKLLQEDEQIHGDDHNESEEKIEKNQDQILLPIQDNIEKKDEKKEDKKDDLKAKLSIEIGIADNNELYETVDNGIMKTVFRAKTMEDLAESEKEFLADFKRKMVADKSRFHDFSMIKSSSGAAKAEMDKSWGASSPVQKYERTNKANENNDIFQANQRNGIEEAAITHHGRV